MPTVNLLSFASWSLNGLKTPWSGRSLYEYISMNGGASQLPDKADKDENKIGWTAGALDGVTSHHLFEEPKSREKEEHINEVLKALAQLVKRSSGANLSSLYTVVQGEPILPISDDLQTAIKATLLNRYKSRIAEVGRYLATRADERENTKFGILLIEISGTEGDREALELLATHDEFTLYSALALAHIVSNPEQALWDVAKRVHGWGRVQVVERLSSTQNRDIHAWMLRDGFRNHVMDEYLAGICAKTGRLHEALKSTQVDKELLDGAAGIIKALIYGGPADSYRRLPPGFRGRPGVPDPRYGCSRS